MCWAKIEGKVLKVKHTKAFSGHNKESHLSLRGKLMVMMVCVCERKCQTDTHCWLIK